MISADKTESLTTGGAPSVPVEAREELLALKSGGTFLCTRPEGDIRPGRLSGEGLYAEDTRHLSELVLTVSGVAPVLLSSTMETGHRGVINATNPTLGADEQTVPQETLNIRRTLLVSDRLHYEVDVRSFHPRPVAATIELSLAADFADVFEVRRIGRQTTGRVLPPTTGIDQIHFAYLPADGQRRETLVQMMPAPARIELHEGSAQAIWELELTPGETVRLSICVRPGVGPDPGPAPTLERAIADADARHRTWLKGCARIATDNDLFDRFVDASMRDLHALMLPLGELELPAAGIPWYVAPFGRDSLLTACETLMINPDVARGTLMALAGLQATEDDPWRDAEPGKILHELRMGELARTGVIPHTPYYGTVDATPLFLMLAGYHFRWTQDIAMAAELKPAFDAALEWIDSSGDRDGDGFVEYERRSPAGLVNQGWKDSFDAVVHADGSIAQGPIALVEVQAYVYEAKRVIAEVYDALGDTLRADRLRLEAETLRTAFNEAFWDEEQGYYVLALDGNKRQVRSVTSNAAHALYCGIATDEKAQLVAERLMAPDMYSGWGVRTLSSESPAYNPMSYHNGSVWPHDNAIAAAGLKRYGMTTAAARIAGGLFDVAAGERDFRLPELFCGFGRRESTSVVSYPVACIPQAWAATAPFLLVQGLLGISADAANNTLSVDRPLLPDWLSSIDLHEIRVGRSRVSLSFRHTSAGSTGFALLEQDGDVRVTMSA